jgi:hypothetical protein
MEVPMEMGYKSKLPEMYNDAWVMKPSYLSLNE